MTGCCSHCEPDLCVSTTHFPQGHWDANWEDGHCPACAEAERIAAECDARASNELSRPSAYRVLGKLVARAYKDIADFARDTR